MINCKICERAFKSCAALTKHVNQAHKISSQNYYLIYINSETPKCKCCSTIITKFKTIELGFNQFCSNRCSAIYIRKDRKNNRPDDELKFREKLSLAIKLDWEVSDNSVRISNISKTINSKLANTTKEERIEIFGWLNKLDQHSKQKAIDKILSTGCHSWWKTATNIEKQKVIDKRSEKIKLAWQLRGDEILGKQRTTLANILLEDNEPTWDDDNTNDVKLCSVFNV